MQFVQVKSKEEVCAARAISAANEKHDEKIDSLLEIFKESKSGLDAQAIYIERRKKTRTQKDMYDYFFENFEHGEDSLVNESDKRIVDLRSASKILSESLKNIGV
jgi:hypothetical protein